jgi:hypothetical protein
LSYINITKKEEDTRLKLAIYSVNGYSMSTLFTSITGMISTIIKKNYVFAGFRNCIPILRFLETSQCVGVG